MTTRYTDMKFTLVPIFLAMLSRGVGTCVRVGGKTKSGGAKDMNFKEKPIFFSNFG